jgi:hypothetical protein
MAKGVSSIFGFLFEQKVYGATIVVRRSMLFCMIQ